MVKSNNAVRLYKEKLNLLLEVAQTVNEDSSVEDLMQEFETLLKDDLGVGKILVFTLDENARWQCILQSCVSNSQMNAINIGRDLKGIVGIEELALNENPALEGFDAVIPLRHKHKVMGYVLVGDNELGDGISPTLRNLKFIQILANIIIVFIENKKMQANLLKQEGLRKELALASKIQAGLVPPEGLLLQTGHMRALSYYHPHHEVGGDYFDVMRLSHNTIGFCIADVTGKGIAAALLMSNVQAMVRSLFTAHVSMKKLMEDLNHRISESASGKFVTMFIARYNCVTGRLTYVNAGHLPPLVYMNGVIKELMAGCLGLGMLDVIPILEVGSIKLHKGDLLVSYTDGLVEVDDGDHIGSNASKLMDIMKRGLGIDRTMKDIINLAEETRNQGHTFDDTSVLAVEITQRPLLSI